MTLTIDGRTYHVTIGVLVAIIAGWWAYQAAGVFLHVRKARKEREARERDEWSPPRREKGEDEYAHDYEPHRDPRIKVEGPFPTGRIRTILGEPK